MLRPTKHSHPDKTVINAALIMLKLLKKKRLVEFDSLRKFLSEKISGGDALFVPSLNFLFLLGLISYHHKNDTFEYVKPHETV